MTLASPAMLILLSFPFCLSAAALTDLQRFIIPNWTSLALTASFFICAIVGGVGYEAILGHAAVGAIALAVGFALFAVGLWGGGDGKLIAATALWFDPTTAMSFVLNMAIAGGALGLFSVLALVFHHRMGQYLAIDAPILKRLREKSPYGVAIAIGGLITFPSSTVFIALTQ